MLKRFLFPSKPDGTFISVILLTVRVVFGILMMNHGIDKWANYQELTAVFPDPLGIGSPLSLGVCNGVYYRFLIQTGHDSHDIYNVCGILRRSWQRPVCGKRTCVRLFGSICTDVHHRPG